MNALMPLLFCPQHQPLPGYRTNSDAARWLLELVMDPNDTTLYNTTVGVGNQGKRSMPHEAHEAHEAHETHEAHEAHEANETHVCTTCGVAFAHRSHCTKARVILSVEVTQAIFVDFLF